MSNNESPNVAQNLENQGPSERVHIKVKDNNEASWWILRTTQFGKLLNAHCDRAGKDVQGVDLFFNGQRVTAWDTADTLEMQDGDTLEVHPNVAQELENQGPSERVHIKVKDNNNKVFWWIQRTLGLGRLLKAHCDRAGKDVQGVDLFFNGQRVTAWDTADTLDIKEGDTLEVYDVCVI
ncbi:hypothetical protein NX059_012344 [Plenodomus lindquistii]|nr:hypothetical protein NX059_012344 [Plenodomus lindquistii]